MSAVVVFDEYGGPDVLHVTGTIGAVRASVEFEARHVRGKVVLRP